MSYLFSVLVYWCLGFLFYLLFTRHFIFCFNTLSYFLSIQLSLIRAHHLYSYILFQWIHFYYILFLIYLFYLFTSMLICRPSVLFTIQIFISHYFLYPTTKSFVFLPYIINLYMSKTLTIYVNLKTSASIYYFKWNSKMSPYLQIDFSPYSKLYMKKRKKNLIYWILYLNGSLVHIYPDLCTAKHISSSLSTCRYIILNCFVCLLTRSLLPLNHTRTLRLSSFSSLTPLTQYYGGYSGNTWGGVRAARQTRWDEWVNMQTVSGVWIDSGRKGKSNGGKEGKRDRRLEDRGRK